MPAPAGKSREKEEKMNKFKKPGVKVYRERTEDCFGEKNEYMEYDEDGNILRCWNDKKGTTIEYKYDNEGRKISSYSYSDGIYPSCSSKYAYYDLGNKGKRVKLEESYGGSRFSATWDYDINGNLVYFQNSHGQHEEFKYNEEGKLTRERHKSGAIETYEYDEKGNMISREVIGDKYHDVEKWEYNKKGKCIKHIFFNSDIRKKDVEIFEYDEKENMVHMKSKGKDEWCYYDINNNIVHKKTKNHYSGAAFTLEDERWKYDENGNCISEELYAEDEKKYFFKKEITHEYKENRLIYTKTIKRWSWPPESREVVEEWYEYY